MKRVCILYNTQAGHGKIARKIDDIAAIFAQAGYEPLPTHLRFGENPFDGFAEQPDMVVVCGGDGTINYVINSMKARSLDIPLGIIPAGTANDFAGAVGMASDHLKAARQIVEGHIERLDCGRVNDLYFINVFSFGMFTTTSQHTSDAVKHRFGKLAYLVEGAKEFFTSKPTPLHVEYEGGEAFDVQSVITLVFNGETAGRFRLARRASVRDGIFDCVIMRRCNIFAMLWAMLLYLLDGRPNFPIRHIRSSHIEMRSPLSPTTDMDGQRSADFPLTIECVAGGVAVVCPE